MKIINKYQIKSENKNLFVNEIEVLTLLNHPNIAKLYGFYEDSNKNYIIIELCEGGTLRNIISNDS